MGKLFLSLYFYILISLLVLSGVIEKYWPHSDPQSNESLVVEFDKSISLLLSMSAGLEEVKKIYPFNLYQLEDIAFLPSQLEQLKAGSTVLLYDHFDRGIWYFLSENDQVYAIGPFELNAHDNTSSLPFIIFLAAVGLPIALWSFWLWRDLQKLRTACEHVANNNQAKLKTTRRSMLSTIFDAFNEMRSRIRGLLDSQRELTSSVSHEFRTPLARLKFSLAILEPELDTPQSARYLKGMYKDIGELESLVSEMLSYASLDSENPKLNIQKVELTQLVKSLGEKCAFGQAATIQYRLPKSIEWDCDEHFLTRAIQNLLMNAFRYAQSCVQVSVEVNNKHVLIKVVDDGPGIDTDLWQQVFKPFTRLDKSRDKSTGGFGLGLAIVDKIIYWHGGVCYLESSPMSGACFVIKLPKISQ